MEKRFTIMVCTRRRQAQLQTCLRSLLPQLDGSGHVVVVVENDSAEYSRDVVERIAETRPDVTFIYALETEIGLSSARNRVLSIALEQVPEWLVFIDDDETARPDWLAATARGIDTFDADVLTGPVHYVLPEELPLFYQPPKLARNAYGDAMESAATNNAVMRKAFMHEEGRGLRFDPQYQFLGGEDTEFFRRVTSAGGRIVWLDDAVVEEIVAPSRIGLSYNLASWQRVTSAEMVDFMRKHGRLKALRRFLPRAVERGVSAVVMLGFGAVAMVFSRRRGVQTIMRGLKKAMAVVGWFRGFFDLLPQPYREKTTPAIHVGKASRSLR
ncbi:glycosyltransferase family 2 protein [Martelella alba]|uniref:Glycosyltransferase family 2 protein n=1 Tax=Martelella alba TaxID=2590451 RepID=A0A506UD05_9HYPH|nr:glycosyltransferase [Martelella alba]TPW31810.1 glycosyltransferase family 2 protein [Martelella alba]